MEKSSLIDTPKIPDVNEKAFGGEVASALQNFGKAAVSAGSDIMKHAEQQAIYKDHQAAYDAADKFRTGTQDILFNERFKKKKGSDGKEYDIPDSILNRNLEQADGATPEYDQRIHELKIQTIDSLQSPRAKALALRSINGIDSTYRMKVIAHEATQMRLGTITGFKKSIAGDVQEAASATDPEHLNFLVSQINEKQDNLSSYQGKYEPLDQDSITLEKAKNIGKAIENAATSKLMQTGRLQDAMDLMGSVKIGEQGLPEDIRNNIQQKLERKSTQIFNQQIRQRVEGQVSSAVQLYAGLANGKIKPEDLNPTDFQSMNLPMQTQIAMNTELKELQKGRLKTDQGVNPKKLGMILSDEDDAFAEAAASIINNTDQAGMITTLDQLYHGNGRGKMLSQDRINIITGLVIQRSRNIPIANDAIDQTQYETSLTPEEEKNFQIWKGKNAPNDSGRDYDLRGAFKAGLQPDEKTKHWPDTFKKPGHPTFSDQSIYAKDRPDLAGHWEGEKYTPAKGRANLNIPQEQVEADAGLKEVLSWQKKTGIKDAIATKTYVEALAAGKTRQEAKDLAMHSAIVKRYPGAKPGVNVIVGGNSKARYILPMQTKEEPKKIYNPKTRRVEPNPRYQAKDENAKDSK